MPSKKQREPRTEALQAFERFKDDITQIHRMVWNQLADDSALNPLTESYVNGARKKLDEYEQVGDQGGKSWVEMYKAQLAELLNQFRQACRSRWPHVKLD